MIPDEKQIAALLKKYAPNDKLLEQVKTHGEIVAEIALWCANKLDEAVDIERLESACKLHDIGSYAFIGAVVQDKDFKKNYPGHAIFGAKILRDEGVDEKICRMVETHVLLGLSAEEIRRKGFALPERDYLPDSLEGDLLCYADRFHSKDPVFNDFENFRKRLEEDLPKQAVKMQRLAERFGVPDVNELAERYNHPIR